ncbi:DUF7638 domain-containing protein [Streptomyces graminofaciens]|uniref:DUF7638 domain-containing protein n=1 Tax=Streptomyces graminofaciens TaxID=68212 RepID=UPI003D9B890B
MCRARCGPCRAARTSAILTDLFIYADRLIDCWGLVTVEEFEENCSSPKSATPSTSSTGAPTRRVAAWPPSTPSSPIGQR